MLKHTPYILALLCLMYFYACVPAGEYTKQENIASIYNPGSTSLHPEYKIYHINDTSAKIYVKINPAELLYNRANPQNMLASKVKIDYRVHAALNQREITDSSSTKFTISRKRSLHPIISFLTYNPKKQKKYVVIVTTSDMLRKEKNTSYLFVDLAEDKGRENYFVSTTKDKTPIFTSYISPFDTVKIEHNSKEVKQWYVRYYKNKLKPALPPFAKKQLDSVFLPYDSLWEISGRNPLLFSQKQVGIYHYTSDTSAVGGVVLSTFDDFFPDVKRPRQLIPPLQYITTSKEFRDLKQNENPKLAVDDFWLGIAGTVENAKELIKIYYNRIYFTNKYFSGITEGWKTDRGLIYTIFGPPLTVYKTNEYEKWIYGDNRSQSLLYFTFNKMKNPFSNEYFVLKRDLRYKNIWYRAVDTWRKGKAFSTNNL
ncbi:MAG: hypothetical protein CSB01_00640 [Bacteroidia bacterium]|nr:MAG: hypothetical protein CSB01_00640 [Bacteroidia bacterium]